MFFSGKILLRIFALDGFVKARLGNGLGVGVRGGGLAVFVCLFVCLLLHSIGFMLFIAKVRAEPSARTPET